MNHAPLFLGLIEFLLLLKRLELNAQKRSGLLMSGALTEAISLFDERFCVRKCSS